MGEEKRIKVVLVSPPPPSPLAFVDYQNPLIGLAYLAAVLERNGHEVLVVDCPALHLTYKDVEQQIRRFNPDIVGVTSVTATFSSALKIGQIAKETCPQALVVFGGPHVTIADDKDTLRNKEVDVVVKGEGEETIVDLAQYASDSGVKSLCEIAGIAFRNNGQAITTPGRPCIENLNSLPYPAYHLFPLTKYRIYGKLGLSMLTSRGCTSKCSFCLVPQISGNCLRARTPQSVADEFEWLKNKYNPGFVSFNDEIFTYNHKRTLEICSGIKQKKIKIPWDCQTRVDCVSRELLNKMAEANCQLITYGVESGSQKILNAIKKGTTIPQNENAVRWAKEAGLSVGISLFSGYPGETAETLKQTIDFIKKAEPDDVYLYLATPYPKIELRDMVKDLGWKMSEDWNCYESQSPTFENKGISFEHINKTREIFYNQLYSPAYILKQAIKGTVYSQIMVQNGLHQLLWRIKIPWASAIYKRIIRK